MSSEWRKDFFNFKLCSGHIEQSTTGNIKIKGNVSMSNPNALVTYWAANPPHRNGSFSGSGMPYANPEQAFDRSPNVGGVRAKNGYFEFKIKYPSAYYTGLGTLYIEPQVHFKICSEGNDHYETVKLGQGVPFRTLTHPAPPTKRNHDSPLFYESKLPIRGQETILRSAGYPGNYKMPDNFWGMKPPN
jgi:hypothetical protein